MKRLVSKVLPFVITIFFFSCKSGTQIDTTNELFANPVIPGFYPDPSVCRVGDDYYLVTSSFEWFPGIPVFHSKDLVNWKQIGHALERPGQVELPEGLRSSGGIYAATIRYHDGLFYIVTTCIDCGGNFYVTAENPSGPWSDPVWVEGAFGFDPTLFWDDDGTCWYLSAANLLDEKEYDGQNGAYIQKYDLENNKLVGEVHHLTFGFGLNAVWGEGPHIYKIDGRYLLMISEGGTGPNHAITVFASDKITGPYVPSKINPVLTHRHLGRHYPITCTGHADLVQTQTGEWWAVLLAVRPREGMNILGRETFLCPVVFENGWPVFNPGYGIVKENDKRPDLQIYSFVPLSDRDEFDSENLALFWNQVRTPKIQWYSLNDGKLILNLRPERTTEKTNPAMLVRRIQHFNFSAFTTIQFDPGNESEEAGLIALHNEKNQYRLALTRKQDSGIIRLIKVSECREEILVEEPFRESNLLLGIKNQDLGCQFFIGTHKENIKQIGDQQDIRLISSSTSASFTGPYVGVYATSNGIESKNRAVFDWFEYKAEE